MINTQCFQKYLLCLILLYMVSCQKPSTEAIGFTIEGRVSKQEVAKIFPAMVDEKYVEPFFVIEFYNWGNQKYYVDSIDSFFCFPKNVLFFHKNKKNFASNIGEFYGPMDLCAVEPKSHKRFVTEGAPLIPDPDMSEIEIYFLLYSEKQDSTFTIKKTFKVEEGKIVY